MKKILLTLNLVFMLTNISLADYEALEIYEMILKADIIAYGQITEVDDSTFTFKIEKNITGKESIIKVEKFENWTCAHRWAEYKVGQKATLLLKEGKSSYYTMSAGNEGEIPAAGDSLYINALSIVPIPTYLFDTTDVQNPNYFIYHNTKTHIIDDNKYHGLAFSIDEFLNSAASIRECFQFDVDQYRNLTNLRVICNDDKIDKLLSDNFIFMWAYHNLIK